MTETSYRVRIEAMPTLSGDVEGRLDAVMDALMGLEAEGAIVDPALDFDRSQNIVGFTFTVGAHDPRSAYDNAVGYVFKAVHGAGGALDRPVVRSSQELVTA